MSKPHNNKSTRQNWRTPLWLYYGITGGGCTHDVAADSKNSLCVEYFDGSEARDGLYEQWGMLNWCNPPFDKVSQFVDKAICEAARGNITYLLTTGATETKWFAKAYAHSVTLTLITGRIAFIHPDTGQPVKGNPAGSAVFLIGPDTFYPAAVGTMHRDSIKRTGEAIISRLETSSLTPPIPRAK
jgi:phage N-6-adenine-methyltransferase